MHQGNGVLIFPTLIICHFPFHCSCEFTWFCFWLVSKACALHRSVMITRKTHMCIIRCCNMSVLPLLCLNDYIFLLPGIYFLLKRMIAQRRQKLGGSTRLKSKMSWSHGSLYEALIGIIQAWVSFTFDDFDLVMLLDILLCLCFGSFVTDTLFRIWVGFNKLSSTRSESWTVKIIVFGQCLLVTS